MAVRISEKGYVREVFDLMPAEGEEAAAAVATRMTAVPEAHRQFSQTLLGAARNGRPPARLQVEEVAKQCAAWAAPADSFYSGLVKRLTGVPDSLRGELDAAAREATSATAALGDFLLRELLPLAVMPLASRTFTPRLSASAPWAWTRCARPCPAARDGYGSFSRRSSSVRTAAAIPA